MRASLLIACVLLPVGCGGRSGNTGDADGGADADGGSPPAVGGDCPTLAPDPSVGQILPQALVDTSYTEPTGAVRRVNAGDNLQTALDAAQPGDIIELAAGASFTGPFTLPKKTGDRWIVIRSSQFDQLPEHTRVTPNDLGKMATLVAPASENAVAAADGAHHYRFIGLEIRTANAYTYALVDLSGSTANITDLPHHIIIDRCYLHGDAVRGTRRGVALNSGETGIVDSYFTDFKEVGADSQAIGGWAGSGPYKIVNNYLAGAGENIM